MGLLDPVQVNVLEVVSHPCPYDRITLLHATIRTNRKLSRVAKPINRMKNKLEDQPQNLLIVDLLFLQGSCYTMSITVICRRNEKKGNKDDCKSWRLPSNCRVDISMTQIYCPFFLVTRRVCKMCLVWIAGWMDNRSSMWPQQPLKRLKSS